MPNDAELISPLNALLIQVIAGMELISGTELVRMGVALEHAVLNAMYRGNLALGPSVTPPHRAIRVRRGHDRLDRESKDDRHPYKDRLVHVDATASKDEIRIVVRDQGKGFKTSEVPGPGDPKVLDTESGRGLVLMASFTDELIFNDIG